VKPAAGGTPLIAVDRVSKRFGAHPVLREVSTAFAAGEVTAILGASGSGKSTLLRIINRLEQQDSGTVVVDGIEIGAGQADSGRLQALRSEVGMVFQQFNLFPHLSVLDNIALAPRRVRGTPRAQAQQQARDLLARVGLSEHAHKHPFALSGGQQQRVAIARALAMQPRALLFDEPTSALDPEMVKEVLDVMQELARSGMTMIVVTHELAFAREVGDRILFLEQGRILQDAPPEDFFARQQDARIRAFLGKVLR